MLWKHMPQRTSHINLISQSLTVVVFELQLKKGEVTENDIITVLPFGNLISQIQVKGSDVEKAFEHSLSLDTETQDGKKVLGANGGFLQVSDSLRVYYDINKASGQRINAIKVLNKENGEYEDLNPNRTYYVTTNDFTA